MSAQPAIVQYVQTLGETNLNIEESIKQFDPSQHEIFNRRKRKKRKITTPTGETGPDGKPVTKTDYEEVNRISVAFQQIIVKRRVAFMNIGNMNILANAVTNPEKNMLAMVKKCREDNKMQFKLKEIAKRMMSELHAAQLWYSEDVEAGYWGDIAPKATKRMRAKILSPLLGDKLLPVFDGNGKMVYFARSYKATADLSSQIDIKNPDAVATSIISNKEIERLDIYSDTTILKFEMVEGVWVFKERIDHAYGALPVIYFAQPDGRPEWYNAQPAIERVETLVSNFGDTNDANGWPILFAKGVIKTMPARGETAKIINVVPQINKDGKEVGESDLRYVSWDRAPESIKLELETLINFVYTCTQTADISTKGMAELSIQSGEGFKQVFIDSQLAANDHTQGGFGESTQRELNFLKKACAAINIDVKPALNLSLVPDFPEFKINDMASTINALTSATGGEPILSQKTAVAMSGLVADAEAEYKQIKAETDTLGNDVGGNDPNPVP